MLLLSLLRRLAYPLTTGGAVTLAVVLLGRGVPAWGIGFVVVALGAIAVAGFERVIPFRAEWARSQGDFATDVCHFVISNRGFDLGAAAAIALVPRVVSFWPDRWPLAAQVPLALVLTELPGYWIHRLQHARPLLWRLHAVHHSSTRLYWWNLARAHPCDNFLTAFASLAILALVGVGEAPLAVVAAFSAAHGLLQHSNADLQTGLLDIFLSTARVHRWHHSRILGESNANYGQTITVWDWVFGTRRFDAREAPPAEVGLAEPTGDGRPFPTTFLGHLRSPFVSALWKRA